MKKFASILAVLMLSIGAIMAQENYKAVKGYVVDKNGNPIPGAEVMAPGGGESAITDSDGSFNMNVHPLLKKLTATYDGMTTKTLKIKPDKDLVFRLKKEKKHPGFLNFVFGPNFTPGYFDTSELDVGLSFGLMGGMYGKWGFYAKAYGDPLFTGSFGISAGVIKSIYKLKAFIYAGAGYGQYESFEDYYDEYYDWYWNDGTVLDFGFMFKTSTHFNFTIGYSGISNFKNSGCHSIQLGLGYVF